MNARPDGTRRGKRRLFLRIFAWYWSTLILLVLFAASLVTMRYLMLIRSEPDPEPSAIVAEELVGMGPVFDGALAIYERGGTGDLCGHLEDYHAGALIDIYWFDGAHHEVCGREVPQRIGQLAQRVWQSREPGADLDGDIVVSASVIESERLGAQVVAWRHAAALVAKVGVPDPDYGPAAPSPALRGEPWPDEAPESLEDVQFYGPPPWLSEWLPPELFVVLGIIRPLDLLVLALISGIVCWLLARSFLRPMAKLREATRELADGELSTRVGKELAGRRDEIGELGRSFDAMASRIESLIDAQRSLLGDVSHELRSPLARLSLALGIARRDAGEGSSAPFERIEREVDRLNELIGQLLALARCELSSFHERREELKVHPLLGELLEDVRFEAEAGGVDVTLESCEEPRVMGVPELLRSALENVLRNAVRHSPAGSSVELACRTEPRARPDTLWLSVRDHGPGLPDEELERVFRPFVRHERAGAKRSNGVGLGLAIAQRIVRAHGGAIRAANHENGGLLVSIALPLVRSLPR